MGNLISIVTGFALLGAVAYLGASWGMAGSGNPADVTDASASIRCTDERGVATPPEGIVVGGPDDNTDQEPYKSWYAKCRHVLAQNVGPAPADPAPRGADQPGRAPVDLL